VWFFWYEVPMLSTPHLSPLPFPKGRGEKDSEVDATGWKLGSDDAKHRKEVRD